ncbi:MAG: hypothetical protein ACREC4_08275 [Methylocella sp.]
MYRKAEELAVRDAAERKANVPLPKQDQSPYVSEERRAEIVAEARRSFSRITGSEHACGGNGLQPPGDVVDRALAARPIASDELVASIGRMRAVVDEPAS